MKLSFTTFTSRKGFIFPITFLIVLFSVVTISSCYVGTDGRPGMAYVAFDWELEKPEYIDCGTPAVPKNFLYGTYYRINPGWYTCYYEGKVWNGSAWGSYAWELDYEIWQNSGERGRVWYNGRDGLNTYLTILCSPYGPELFRRDDLLRTSNPLPIKSTEIKPNDEHVTVYDAGDFTVTFKYRKVNPKNLVN